jgi:predicted peptidase
MRGDGETDVLQVISLVKKVYSIDMNRIYLVGQSMGGHGALFIGSRHPEMFAAVASLCGYGMGIYGQEWSQLIDPTAFRKTKLFFYHGSGDMTVPVEESRKLDARLQELGISHFYKEYPGAGHNQLTDLVINQDFLDRLLKEKR